MGSLQEVGASEAAERVYGALLLEGECGVAEIAGRLELELPTAAAAATELQALGLVAAHGERLVSLPPRVALEAVAEQRAREASAARVAATELAAVWATRDTTHPFLEVLESTAAVDDLSLAMKQQATTELLALSVGPVGDCDLEPDVAPGTLEMLARGVAVRAVYGSAILQNPLALAAVTTCIEGGEQARVCPEVPVNLLVTDSCALVVVVGPGDERLNGLLVHPSDLFDRLRATFEVFWGMGVPLAATATPRASELPANSRELLLCLAAGLTDESIAQKLGVSGRTVARRVSVLQERLGARSRFQLGVQASRLGWL